MRITSKLFRFNVIALVALTVIAPSATAGGARYFKDQDQKAFRISLHATAHRVLSGLFAATGRHTLTCSSDALFMGGFPIKAAKIANGRFHSVSSDTLGEGGSWTLTVRGRLHGDTIRGTFALHYRNIGAEGSETCWSGTSEGHAAVRYAAKAGR